MEQGLYIVVEGPNKIGKSHVVDFLSKELYPGASTTKEPDWSSPSGIALQMTRSRGAGLDDVTRYLQALPADTNENKMLRELAQKISSISDVEVLRAHLFMINRYEICEKVRRFKSEGRCVISDRSFFSTLVASAPFVQMPEMIALAKAVNVEPPDVLIVLYGAPEVIMKRVAETQDSGRYNTAEFVRMQNEAYKNILQTVDALPPEIRPKHTLLFDFSSDDHSSNLAAVREKLKSMGMLETDMKSAIFLDKDGTMVDESAYTRARRTVGKEAAFKKELIPTYILLREAVEGLAILARTKYLLIVVSNQPQIERGVHMTEEVEQIFMQLRKNIEAVGGRLDAYYYCPHTEEASCNCKKPLPGLIELAAKQHNIDLTKSWIIGDSETDIGVGLRMGLQTVLVKTGLGKYYSEKPDRPVPHHIFADLTEAAKNLFAGNITSQQIKA